MRFEFVDLRLLAQAQRNGAGTGERAGTGEGAVNWRRKDELENGGIRRAA